MIKEFYLKPKYISQDRMRSDELTSRFTEEEFLNLPIGEFLTKYNRSGVLEFTSRIKKFNTNITLYQNWITNGTGSTSIIFTGEYHNLRESKLYRTSLYCDIETYDKIHKEGNLYMEYWKDIETGTIGTKYHSTKEEFDKQNKQIRIKKFKRINDK